MHRYTPNSSKWTTLYNEIRNSFDSAAFQSAAWLNHTDTNHCTAIRDNQVSAQISSAHVKRCYGDYFTLKTLTLLRETVGTLHSNFVQFWGISKINSETKVDSGKLHLDFQENLVHFIIFIVLYFAQRLVLPANLFLFHLDLYLFLGNNSIFDTAT